MLKQSILMLCCTLASTHLLSAATYYVNASTGSDSAAGSSGAPWQTLRLSIPKLHAGDTLLATGTFSDSPGYGNSFVMSVSGSAGSPITIKAQGNATINMSDNNGDACAYDFTGNYIVIDGFGFTSTMASGVYYGGFLCFGGSHCIAQNCVFSNAYGSHDTAAGGADHLWCIVNQGNFNTYSNLFFHEINDADITRMWGTNNVITSCIVSNCQNQWYDSGGTKLHADVLQFWYTGVGSISNVVERCLFLNNGGDQGALGVSGGMMNCGDTGGTLHPDACHDIVYRNNVFAYHSQWIQEYAPGFHLYNNLFYNCGSSTYNQIVYVGNGGSGVKVQNNVFISSGYADGSGTSMKNYNAWDAASQSASIYLNSGYGTSNIVTTATACGFVNASSLDFHLTPSSILRGKGVNLSSDSSASAVDRDGNARPSSGAWDIGPYQYAVAGPATNPVIQVSPSSLAFGPLLTNTTATNSFVVRNAGGGTLGGKASVPAPFYIVGDGAYSLGSNQSQTVSVSYRPSGPNDSQVVTFTGGGGATATVSGSLLAIQSGLSFESYAGTITAPFSTNGGYVSQSVQTTDVASGGSATYFFNITNAGDYIVEASVLAQNAGSKSFWVNIDAMPVDPAMIWDIYPYSTSFQTVAVSWRGNSTSITNDQYSPSIFTLASGIHELIIIGREANVGLGQITVAPYLADRPIPPSPPPGLRVVATGP